MNPKFEEYVYGIIKKFSPRLLMEMHTWDVKYGLENKNAIMECVCNYPYLNIVLNYGDSAVKRWKEGEDVVPYIVHEMCHPITDPLYCKGNERYASKNEVLDERERLTDYICNIVLKNIK